MLSAGLRLAASIVLTLTSLALASASFRAVGAENPPDPRPPVGAVFDEEVIDVPVEATPPIALQTTIFVPQGTPPFPLAVMNHGADHADASKRGVRYHRSNAIFYFLSRGYAVAVPMMRGFAGSGGDIHHHSCDFLRAATENAEDIAAVLRNLQDDPRFDARRVVVAGQSLGGFNTLALGALNLPNVVGLVNFNGGLRESDCRPGDQPLVDAFAKLGARTKVKSIWFYGDNDALFPTSLWRAMYAAYRGAGGSAEVHDVGIVEENSHRFLSDPDVLTAWTKPLDAFLSDLDLPHQALHPGDLPVALPPATAFARIDDVNAVPGVNEDGKGLYRKFLSTQHPRVFALDDRGGAHFTFGGFDPLGQQMESCARSGRVCRIYAVDNRVVWTPWPPRERSASVTLKSGQSSSIGFFTRLDANCASKEPAAIEILRPPEHGQVELRKQLNKPNFAEGSPLAKCNARTVDGIAILYTPASGFSGPDDFVLAEKLPGGLQTILKIRANVE